MTSRSRPSKGFTLSEVLISLGLASLVIGIVLQSSSRDVMSVTRAPQRYQSLLRASQVLEFRMEEDRPGDDPFGSFGEKFPYDISTKPVVTDARVEQVEVAVSSGSGRREAVSAYRLKIRRRQSGPKPSATPNPPPDPNAESAPAAAPLQPGNSPE